MSNTLRVDSEKHARFVRIICPYVIVNTGVLFGKRCETRCILYLMLGYDDYYYRGIEMSEYSFYNTIYEYCIVVNHTRRTVVGLGIR